MDDRLRQLHPLALPGAHGPDRSEPLLAEPDLPERVARPAGGLAAGESVQLGDVADDVGGADVGGQGVVLGRVAEAGPHLGTGGPRVTAEDRRLPASGRCRPSSIPSSVVLPAPLAPSRPVTPRPTVNVVRAQHRRLAPALDDAVRPDGRLAHVKLENASRSRQPERALSASQGAHDGGREVEAPGHVIERHPDSEGLVEGVAQQRPAPPQLGLGLLPRGREAGLRVVDGSAPGCPGLFDRRGSGLVHRRPG